MKSEGSDKEEAKEGQAKTKLCGVILLTDNRESGAADKSTRKDFRCSGFKCNQANRQKHKSTRSSFRKIS